MIRICARYGNLDILEEGYGINLLPLATFAMNTYRDDPCECFKLKGSPNYSASEMLLDVKMHKAISVIQFKVEGRLSRKIRDLNWINAISCIILTMKRVQLNWMGKNIKCWIRISRQLTRKAICTYQRRRGYYGAFGKGI